VADFGLGRLLNNSSYYTSQGGMLPVRWMAPEVILMGKSLLASDVWSFGVVLWEVYSKGAEPYTDLENIDLVTRLEQGHPARLQPPPRMPTDMTAIMMSCLNDKIEQRPSFSVLHQWLAAGNPSAVSAAFLAARATAALSASSSATTASAAAAVFTAAATLGKGAGSAMSPLPARPATMGAASAPLGARRADSAGGMSPAHSGARVVMAAISNYNNEDEDEDETPLPAVPGGGPPPQLPPRSKTLPPGGLAALAGDVVLQGWLVKQGGGASTFGKTSWKKRWYAWVVVWSITSFNEPADPPRRPGSFCRGRVRSSTSTRTRSSAARKNRWGFWTCRHRCRLGHGLRYCCF
jgi:hypothetical protein